MYKEAFFFIFLFLKLKKNIIYEEKKMNVTVNKNKTKSDVDNIMWRFDEKNPHCLPRPESSMIDQNVNWLYPAYDGIQLTTSFGEVVFVGMSSGHICCEETDISIDGKSFSEFDFNLLMGSTVNKLKLNVKREKLLTKQNNSDRDDKRYNCVCVDIYTTHGIFKVDVSSAHNGYYSHDFIALAPGYRKLGNV
jgi:hypothetical protein